MDQLNDGIRKLILAGIGAVAATKEKSEVILDELVKKGERPSSREKCSMRNSSIISKTRSAIMSPFISSPTRMMKKNRRTGGDEGEAAPQGDLMDAVDSMDDEQLTALKARIQAAEAARAEKNETPKESSSDENTEG